MNFFSADSSPDVLRRALRRDLINARQTVGSHATVRRTPVSSLRDLKYGIRKFDFGDRIVAYRIKQLRR